MKGTTTSFKKGNLIGKREVKASKIIEDTHTEDNKKSQTIPSRNTSKKQTLLDIKKIKVNPFQPRKNFNNIEELALSIKSEGLLQPIVVAIIKDELILIAGERRFRAYKQLNTKHGSDYSHIEATTLLDISMEKLEELALIENVQREDMSVIETADAYGSLSKRGLSLAKIVSITGRGKTSVHRYVIISSLPEKVKDVFKNHKTASTNKIELLSKLKDEESQIHFAEQIIKEMSFDTLKRQIESILDKKSIKEENIKKIFLPIDKLLNPKELFPIKLYRTLDDTNKAKADDLILEIEKKQKELLKFKKMLEGQASV